MALTESLVVYDNTLGAVMRFKTMIPKNDNRFDFVPLRFVVNLDPQALVVLKGNPLLKEAIQLDVIPIVANAVVAMPPPGPNTRFDSGMRMRVEQLLRDCEPKINAVVDKVLTRHAAMNAAWDKYFKSQRKELIFAAVGVGLSAISVGLAVPTGGASIAVAVVGGARALITGATKLAECWRTAEDYETRVKNNIKAIADAYGRSKHAGRAMQIGGAALNSTGLTPLAELLPFIRRDLLPSMSKIKADMGIWKGKLGSLYAAANTLANELFELLDKIDEWKKLHPGQEMPKLAKLEENIDALLESGTRMARFRNKVTIGAAYRRYDVGMQAFETIEQQFVLVQNLENNPKAVQIAANVVKVLVNVGFTLANYNQALALAPHPSGMEIAQGMGIAQDGAYNSAPAIGGTAAGWASDVIGTGKDIADLATECGLTPEQDDQIQQYQSMLAASYAQLPPPLPPRGPVANAPIVRRPPPPNRPLPPVPNAALASGGGAVSSPPGPATPPPRPPRSPNRIVIRRSTP